MKALFKKKQADGGGDADVDSPERRFIRESNEWSQAGRRAPVAYGAEYRTRKDDVPYSQQAASPPMGYNSNGAFGRTGAGSGEAYEARSEVIGSNDAGYNDPGVVPGSGKKKGGLLSRLGGKKSDSTSSSQSNGRQQWANASRQSHGYAGSHPGMILSSHNQQANSNTPRASRGNRTGVPSGGGVHLKIGWFCATGNDDWSRVLEMCDEVSRSEAESKDAAKALRKEIKYGTPETQERALRLTTIMMWNTSDRFRLQIASKRFLEVVEDLAKSQKTDPNVRQMLYKAFAALAFDYQRDGDLMAITATYNKIKPIDAPFNGHPLDDGDTTFDPTTMPRRHRSLRSRQWQQNPPVQRDILAESELARNNAKVLIEALAFTSPAEFDGNDLIKEFHAKCLQSQNQLLDDIPWATAQAEQSRANRPPPPPVETPAPAVPVSTRPFSSENPYASLVSPAPAPAPAPPQEEETPEEKLLAALLTAHGDLMEAFKQHEELEKLARNEREMHEVEERSKVETRFDRTKAVQREDGEWEERGRGFLGVDGGPVASGSRSPSPVPGAALKPEASGSGSSASSAAERSPPAPSAPEPNSYFQRPKTPPRITTPPTNQVDEGYITDEAPGDKLTSEPDAISDLKDSYRSTSSPYTSPNRRAASNEATHSTSSHTGSTGSGGGGGGGVRHFASNNPFASAIAASQSSASSAGATHAAGDVADGPTVPVRRSGTMDSVIVTPVEPSEKAKGKMRRFSGRDGDVEAEERQREEEERLRSRYRS